ncbi:MAG: hypothetical protein AMS15_03005 [Planctomycetes bacterium DG_23]|nr:MAG: hypothetical protein AMS15_03005 [Planctomycetes bacterium DG_23]
MRFLQRLESLYRAERCRLFTYALSLLGDESLAEDVVQDVFRRFCETPVNPKDLRSFVYRSVRNRAIDLLRRKSRRKTYTHPSAPASIYAIDTTLAEQSILSQERAHQVETALQTLRIEEREIIVLHIYNGLTFDAIAKILDAPIGTMVSRYHRSLTKLQKKLKGEKAQ